MPKKSRGPFPYYKNKIKAGFQPKVVEVATDLLPTLESLAAADLIPAKTYLNKLIHNHLTKNKI